MLRWNKRVCLISLWSSKWGGNGLCSLWQSQTQIPKLECCNYGCFLGVVERRASAIDQAHLEKGQPRKLPFHQGHLWGKGLAAGGGRPEDASDAQSGHELGCPLGCQGGGSSVWDGVILCRFVIVVTGVSRDLCVLIQALSSISRQWCVTLVLVFEWEVISSSNSVTLVFSLFLSCSQATLPRAFKAQMFTSAGKDTNLDDWWICCQVWKSFSRGRINPVKPDICERYWCHVFFHLELLVKLNLY